MPVKAFSEIGAGARRLTLNPSNTERNRQDDRENDRDARLCE